MNSKERVIRAATFTKPDRIPVDLPEPWHSDIRHTAPGPDLSFKPEIKGTDEWGCVWEKLHGDKTMGQVKKHPLEDYSLLGGYCFPDYASPERYKGIREIAAQNKEEKFLLGIIPFSLIHRLEYLRSTENAWTDSYTDPDNLNILLDKLADIAIDAVNNIADAGVHGILSFDDWGLQDRLILKPEVFREFFKPRYKRVYTHAREKGLITMLHSCGYIVEILDDLIECGLQVIQMDQQENMGIADLSRRFGGRITFWCPVDIQTMMLNGSLDDIRAYARKLIDNFGKFNGGFMGKWYPDPDAVGHSRERIDAMAEAFTKYGSTFYQK